MVDKWAQQSVIRFEDIHLKSNFDPTIVETISPTEQEKSCPLDIQNLRDILNVKQKVLLRKRVKKCWLPKVIIVLDKSESVV